MKSSFRYKFSICVPTYNRKNTLPALIKSVADQTFKDFELIIIDDGSTDGTKQYINSLIDRYDFKIKYVWQPNGGRHRAINRITEFAEGELVIIFDSDDLLLPCALSRMNYYWETIDRHEKDNFAGVEGLCVDERDGKLIGTAYPEYVFDSDHVTNYYVIGIKGDKTRAIRYNVLDENRFPEIEGENYIPPAYVWNKIALKYKYRYFNEVIAVKRYQKGGVTAKSSIYRAKNPKGTQLYYQDFIKTICQAFPVRKRYYIRSCINFLRFSLHARVETKAALFELPFITSISLFPVAFILYLRDKLQLIKNMSGMISLTFIW